MTRSEIAELVAGSNMDLRPGDDGPGIIAFLIVAGLVVVCVFLYRSMRKQLGKINFETPDGAAADRRHPAGTFRRERTNLTSAPCRRPALAWCAS